MSNTYSTKTRCELRWPIRVNYSSTTSGTRGLILVTFPGISLAWGKDRLVITTNVTHPLSFVKNILIATVKRWKWWLQLSHYESLNQLLPCSQQPSINESMKSWSKQQALEYRTNWEIYMHFTYKSARNFPKYKWSVHNGILKSSLLSLSFVFTRLSLSMLMCRSTYDIDCRSSCMCCILYFKFNEIDVMYCGSWNHRIGNFEAPVWCLNHTSTRTGMWEITHWNLNWLLKTTPTKHTK